MKSQIIYLHNSPLSNHTKLLELLYFLTLFNPTLNTLDPYLPDLDNMNSLKLISSRSLIRIKKASTPKNTIIAFFLLLIMTAYIMPGAVNDIHRHNNQTQLLDGRIWTGPSLTFEMIDAYGENGRQLYMIVEATAGFFYSIILAVALTSALVLTGMQTQFKFLNLSTLVLIPVFGMLINWIENLSIVTLLWFHPIESYSLALLTSIFTLTKWSLLFLCLEIIICQLAMIAASYDFFTRRLT